MSKRNLPTIVEEGADVEILQELSLLDKLMLSKFENLIGYVCNFASMLAGTEIEKMEKAGFTATVSLERLVEHSKRTQKKTGEAIYIVIELKNTEDNIVKVIEHKLHQVTSK